MTEGKVTSSPEKNAGSVPYLITFAWQELNGLGLMYKFKEIIILTGRTQFFYFYFSKVRKILSAHPYPMNALP